MNQKDLKLYMSSFCSCCNFLTRSNLREKRFTELIVEGMVQKSWLQDWDLTSRTYYYGKDQKERKKKTQVVDDYMETGSSGSRRMAVGMDSHK